MAYEKGWVDFGNKEFMDLRRYGSQLGKGVPTSEYWKVFEQAEKMRFRGDFKGFYQSFILPFNLAQTFDLGFYYSTKNGQYKRFTKESLTGLIVSQLDNALTEAQKQQN